MKCVNGSPCLDIEDGKLFYISSDRKLELFVGDNENFVMSYVNYLLDLDGVHLDTSDRFVLTEYVKEFIENYKFENDLKEIADTAVKDCIESFNRLKMYIMVREDIATGHAVNCVGHATNYAQRDWVNDDMYSRWAKYSRKKVTCKVSVSQFESFKKYEDHILVSESVLNGTEVVLIFKPRENWPEVFKRARLFT